MSIKRTSIGAGFKAIWRDLNRSIYVGDRLKANMTALTFVSAATAVLGLVLTVMNIITDQTTMIIASVLTFLAGSGCGFCVCVLKNRNIAIIIPTVFCAVVFTIYILTGAGNGTAMLWSLMLPIGMCYFVSVKYGIILSIYYSALYLVMFYTPLRINLAAYYTPVFMSRFPLLYVFLSIFTGMAMVQYHRKALFEIDYTDRLNSEVTRQTAIAEERAARIEQMSFQTIQTLANAIDAKDPYTKGHSTRVSQYSVLIAEAVGWNADRVNDLRYAAMLHDIGKIGVPDSILNNPKRLTDVEYGIIKSHTTMGSEILRGKIMIDAAEDVARSHHERYDGRGYPNGLRGDEITEESRIVAIADAFDAMSSNRVYRRACDRDHIMHELVEGKGRQFDPEFTDVFIRLWNEGVLDPVIDSGSEDNAGDPESPSKLLQEVFEVFAAQNGTEDIDAMTGIMSRTAGESAIAKAMQECPGCFVFFDVDNLKRINDTCGHEAGDRLLKLAGSAVKAEGKKRIACRLGGDEFLLFMKNVEKDDAEREVREIINAFNSGKADDLELNPASLSAGMVMCTPADSYIQVYGKADKALYHVKQNGKNDCIFYNEESEDFGGEHIDLDKLVSGIRSSGSYEGALDVEYRQFAKLYELVSNLEKRFSHPFKLLMIALEPSKGEASYVEELEKSMFYMEQAIRQTIRNVDIVTRYGRSLFLVILVGSDDDGAKTAVDRIIRSYYKMNGSGAFSPTYTIAGREGGLEQTDGKDRA